MMTSAADRPSSDGYPSGFHGVVRDGYGLIGVDGDDNTVAMSGQRFVDRVVDDLENHMVQTRPVIGVTDVHSGPFSDCVEPF